MEGRTDKGTSGTVDFSGHRSAAVDLTGAVHQLPCCIKYNGPSEVSHYFRPKPTDVVFDGLSVEEAHFRGRKLQGTTLPMPQGYSGYVLGKRKPDGKAKMSQENSDCWEMKAKLKNISYWNHDTSPSQNDDIVRAFHLFAVAKALHRPVSIEDLESASID